ncbi:MULTISPECIES: SDR family NAD(P)-dependent oxidoreductase [Streptosporangium]|uniref:Phthiocerol/phenolphthiocerol synthesis type-I polyketide synthase D n=1 Tax=Streptosporangium brasiliense TaxID=47480 RepID=A0ABT9R667_9ACTN|nr:SDR family NAD(P)-dependent oxidoreductase [Streptosporangium brasiliense]MDP9864738.1 phthiocerol/phenolphthiocerol synthesis type-I polyketide synthase D [Streptosporangium brasiliense]
MDLIGEEEIRRFLGERIATRCRLPLADVDPDRPLEEFGLSSRDAVAVAGELEVFLGRELGPTLVWEYPTINRLARGLASGTAVAPAAGRTADPEEAIAVIGVGCRLPGSVHGPEDFWRLLMAGGDAVGRVPEDRWAAFDDGSPRTAEALAATTRHGGFLDDVAGFDADFFGIVPGEAEVMDPQQRLLLETAWEALEHAGIAPRSLGGSRTGAFVGISGNEYAYLTTADPAKVDAWTATGAAFSIAANRLSYLLDLRGPSLSVDTACSSSLVATDLAVRSLRSGESDLALAAGVNLLLSPVITMAFDQGGGTAPDGRCKSFDASADGMVRAEGCGVAVLKRLADAERDGDRILAVVRATAVNQDGRSNGLVAPNPEAQEELLRAAYAGLDGPDYIEAHGTGTFLGDPIEARAIDAALCGGRTTPLLIGSAKSNLGHLEAAAGITGLIKTVLALHHGVIPPSVHFHRPNPHIPWERLKVVTAPTPWPGDHPRAGVSSFGFGGTNAHVVLERAAPVAPPAPAPGRYGEAGGDRPGAKVFLLTDVSAERVRDHARVLADWVGAELAPGGVPPEAAASAKVTSDGAVSEEPASDRAASEERVPEERASEGVVLGDIAHTLARRAGRGRAGAAVVAADAGELLAGLRAVQGGGGVAGAAVAGGRGPVWVFSGYGSQWTGMGARLYTEEPVFAGVIDELDPMFRDEAGIELREIVAGGREAEGVATAQPVIFAVQVALAGLWTSHGVRPVAVVGHSMGEVAAAVVAGGIGLRDAVRVICRRAGLLGTLGGGGAMAVLEVAAEEVPADLHVAVHASPRQCVVTGDPGRVEEFAAEVRARGLLSRVLTAEGAGHSPQVKPLLPKLRQALAAIAGGKPEIPFYSTVFDDPREVPTFEPAYWAAGVRRPVRLLTALQAAAEDGHTVFTEISPHPVLASAMRDSLPAGTVIIHSLRRGHDEELRLQLAAAAVAMPALVATSSGRVVDLPLSPWRHGRHWVSAARRAALPPGSHPLLGVHVESPAGHLWTTTVDDLSEAPWRLDPSLWRLHGLPVLPLAVVAALAQAAGAEVRGEAELTGVTLDALLPLPATVTTTLTPSGEVEIDARNAAGVWIRYGTATVVPGPSPAGPPPSPAELAERLRGPSGVPVGIGRLGGDGTPVGLLAKDIPATAVPVPLAGKLVARVWEPGPGVETAPAGNGSDPRPARGWLVVAVKGDPRAGRLARDLTAAGHTVGRLDLPGVHLDLPGVAPGAPVPSLVPAQRSAPRRTAPVPAPLALPAGDGAEEVVVLAPSGLNPAGAEALYLAVTRIAAELAGTGRRLRLVTDRAQAVLDGEPGDPGAAALRGLVRVLAFEQAGLRARLLDVDGPDALLAELTADRPDDEVAWRAGVRYTARLAALPDDGDRRRAGAHGPVVRRGGGYLITGGYGGLGLVVARWLAERGAGRIVLGGRSGPSAAGAATIAGLRALGADVQVVTGDLALPGVAEGLVDVVTAGGVRLRGVIHAAGVLDDHLVTDVGPGDLHRVWSAKVHGGLQLHEATRDAPLDWWVAFSSAAALLGSPGQAAYAGANAWLDALCDLRRAEGLPGTTINWGTWADVGGAGQAVLPAVAPLTPDEGVEALEALLARGVDAAGVLRLDAAAAVAAFPGIARMPYFADLAGAAVTGGDWAGPEALAAMEPGQALEAVVAKVRERTAVVLGFETAWLQEGTVLTEAGLDSLAATRVRGMIEHDFGVAVPTALLLQGATLGDVAVAVAAGLGIHGTAGTRPVEPRDAAERQVVAALTRILGRVPGVTEEIPAGVLPVVLDVLGREAGRELAADGVLTGAQVADLLREIDEEEAARGVVRPLTPAARAYLAARRAAPAAEATAAGAPGPGAPAAGAPTAPGDGRVPLFLGHPAGGTTGVYALLAGALGAGQVVFGLERLDGVGTLGAEAGVSERAARYVAEIRKVQPAGPYRVGGWSFGGILAFEIARQLGAENVELVAMIDSGLPDEVTAAERTRIAARRYADFATYLTETYGVPVRLAYDELAGLSEAGQLALAEARIAGSGVLDLLGEAILRHQITSHEDTRAIEGYRAGTYEGRVVLYRSTDPTPWAVEDTRYAHADDPTRGFGPFSPGLEIVTIPGSHHLNLLDPPHVEVIAAHLGGQL